MDRRVRSQVGNSRVLVTGASGAIGSSLTRRLQEAGAVTYCQSRSPRESRWGERWVQTDLSDSEGALRDLPELDLVFHLAAQTSVSQARQDPVRVLEDNVLAFAKLLETLRLQDVPPMVVAVGTVTEVGLPDTNEIHEDLRDDPVTFYDISKLSAELLLKQYVREGWLRGCWLRLATVYGSSGPEQAADRGVIDKVFRQALEGRTVNVYGRGDFLRDYVHIDDVVSALLAAAENPNTINGRVFVIGTGQGITIKEAFECAARIAATLTGRQVDVKQVDPPEGLSPIDFRSAVIDPRAFMEATGWTPRYDLAGGLAKSYGAGLADPPDVPVGRQGLE